MEDITYACPRQKFMEDREFNGVKGSPILLRLIKPI